MTVTIYTSFGWGPCKVTKIWLRNNGLNYEEKNISKEENRQELFELGYKTTPVIVGEKGTVVGYSPAKLSEVFL